MRIHRPGTLIGKALEPLAGGEGEIPVLRRSGYATMKIRTYVSLFVVTLVTAIACSGIAPGLALTESIIGKVWMHVDGPWESPPPKIGLDERTAPATLMRFNAHGSFSMMHCYVIEQDKKLTISNGDGQVIFIGSWSERASAIDLVFRLMYESVPPVHGREYPGPEEKGTATIVGHSIRFRGVIYDDARQLDAHNYDEFTAPEREKLKERARLRL